MLLLIWPCKWLLENCPNLPFQPYQVVIWFPRWETCRQELYICLSPEFSPFVYILIFPTTSCFPSYQTLSLSFPHHLSFFFPNFHSLLLYPGFFLCLSLVVAFTSHFFVRHKGFDQYQEYPWEITRTRTSEISSYSITHQISRSTKNLL